MVKQSQRTSLIRISKIEESQVEELVKQENSFTRSDDYKFQFYIDFKNWLILSRYSITRSYDYCKEQNRLGFMVIVILM